MFSSQIVKRTGAVVAFGLLSACESAEDVSARQTQFNGVPLSEVVKVIGQPYQQDGEMAVWSYSVQNSQRVPNQSLINGRWVVTGYRTEYYTSQCTYTATLKSGVVVDSDYQGNGCRKYAPDV